MAGILYEGWGKIAYVVFLEKSSRWDCFFSGELIIVGKEIQIEMCKILSTITNEE